MDIGGLITGGLSTGGLRSPAIPLERTEPIPERTFPSYPMITPQPFEITSTPRIFQPAGSATQLYGAFYTMYVNGSGDTYLQGGQVKCGESEVLADYKVIDSGTGPTEIAGSKLVIEVTLDGYVEDGVLLAGATATAIIYVTPVDTVVPDDSLPTVGSYTGKKCYLEVGRWTADSFLPAGIGHFLVSFCGTGNYSVRRY